MIYVIWTYCPFSYLWVRNTIFRIKINRLKKILIVGSINIGQNTPDSGDRVALHNKATINSINLNTDEAIDTF